MITSLRVSCYICSTRQHLLIYILCNNEVSTAQTYNIQGTANIWRKVILVHFKILFQHSPEVTEDIARDRRLLWILNFLCYQAKYVILLSAILHHLIFMHRIRGCLQTYFRAFRSSGVLTQVSPTYIHTEKKAKHIHIYTHTFLRNVTDSMIRNLPWILKNSRVHRAERYTV